MYYTSTGQEIEDMEMDTMRADAREEADDLDFLLAIQQEIVREFVFVQEEWNCTEAELLEQERAFGERLAHDAINYAHRFTSLKKRAKELRWWCQVACAFPGSSVHALPILITAIRAIESTS